MQRRLVRRARCARLIRGDKQQRAHRLEGSECTASQLPDGVVRRVCGAMVSAVFPVTTITSELRAKVIRADGSMVDYSVLSRKVVTNNGVAFIVDAFDNTVELENMNYHGAGTGTNSENASDSALQTEARPRSISTRATGTRASPAPIFTALSALTFDADAAITEHSVFSQPATGGGVCSTAPYSARSMWLALMATRSVHIQPDTYIRELIRGGYPSQ